MVGLEQIDLFSPEFPLCVSQRESFREPALATLTNIEAVGVVYTVGTSVYERSTINLLLQPLICIRSGR